MSDHKPPTDAELDEWNVGGGECSCPGYLYKPQGYHGPRCSSVRGRLIAEVRRLRADLVDMRAALRQALTLWQDATAEMRRTVDD